MLRNLKSSVAALALSALLPTVATAQTVLTMSSWVPPSHSLTVTLAAWGAEIEKATNGRVKFQMLPKAPAAAPGTFDAVKDGLVDVSYVTASYLPARHSLPKLPELPGGGATAEINSVAYWRIHEKFLAKAGEYKGVKLIGVFTHGPGQMFNTKKPIDSVDDLAPRRSSSRHPSRMNCSAPAWPTARSSRSNRSCRSSSTKSSNTRRSSPAASTVRPSASS